VESELDVPDPRADLKAVLRAVATFQSAARNGTLDDPDRLERLNELAAMASLFWDRHDLDRVKATNRARLRRSHRCVWCGARDGDSREHVVPKCFSRQTIVLRACVPCNAERGEVAGAYALLCDFLDRDKPWHTDRHRLRRTVEGTDWAKILTLQEKWEGVEAKRLGFSPTGRLPVRDLLEQACEVLMVK